MHLVACHTPQGPLEEAPLSALLSADLGTGDRWECFWAADTYYVRCTRSAGAVEWFMVADEESIATESAASGERRTGPRGTRVIEFPLRRLQTRVVIATAPNGRGMLVGSARRTSRARSAARRAGE
jgi:hypothetical protein